MKLFTTSFRNLYKFRLYTIINILGLALSLACVIIIARYVHQETTVNSFATDLDRTYIMSVEEEMGQPRYGGVDYGRSTNSLLNHHAIERYSFLVPYEEDYILSKENQYRVKLVATDSNFLEILPYPLLYGVNFSAAPDEAILTKGLAERLFGKGNPVGETVTFSTADILKVVGVVDEPSSKSFLEFDMLVNIDLQKGRWSRLTHNLVMLDAVNDVEKINKSNSDFTELKLWGKRTRFQLVPLKSFYLDRSKILYQDNSNPIFLQGNKNSLKILSIVAVLSLFVGLFNFINIYAVINMRRGREFGIKKIYGAGLRQIAMQFFFENLLLIAIALFCAWFLTEITELLLAKKLAFSVHPDAQFDIALSILILGVLSIAVSVYPLIKYTQSTPITSLRSVNVAGVSVMSRKVFLFLQYVISFGLLIIAVFFFKQLNYMLNMEPGYNTQNVIVSNMKAENHFHFLSSDKANAIIERLKNEQALIEQKLDESPLFTDWIFGRTIYDLRPGINFRRSDKDEFNETAIEWLSIRYFKMFDFQLLEGRLWDSTDVFTQYKCIINEAAKNKFDITDIHTTKLQPETRTWYSTDVDTDTNPAYEIVGVIKDFNIGHLSKETVPLVLSFAESGKGAGLGNMSLLARFISGKEKEAAAYLEEIYKQINNNADFSYSLLDDEIARLYEEDKRISNVYTLFAVLAIIVSSMGLFALSLFDIQQRYREIALRKINGATAKDIMHMILKKYLYLLAVAFAAAIPVSYFAIKKYLENFAHQTAVSWWLFVAAAVIVAGISLLTLIWQIKRAMKINPTNVLQSE